MFDIKKLIGMRTIKTTIAIAICSLIMKYIFKTSPFFACIGTLVAMDNSIDKSIKGIINRNYGTLIGGVVGIIFGSYTSNIILLSLGIMLVIIIITQSKLKEAIVPGCIVYLAVIYLNTSDNAYLYGYSRVLETFLGSIIGFIINILIKAPVTKKDDCN